MGDTQVWKPMAYLLSESFGIGILMKIWTAAVTQCIFSFVKKQKLGGLVKPPFCKNRVKGPKIAFKLIKKDITA